MSKKITLLFISLLISLQIFTAPVLAQTAPETNTTTETNTNQTSWWDSITRLFSFIDRIKGTPTTKAIQINSDISQNQNYNSQDFDYTTRTRSYQNQTIDKGKYLLQMIKNQDGYEDLSYTPSGCNSIKLSQMIYFHYLKHQKILYDLNGQLTDYDPSDMEKIKTDITSADSCYYTVYDRMPSVPQGKFHNQDDAAPASSSQLNNNYNDLIPYTSQGEAVPQDNSNQDNTSKIITNNDHKDLSSLLWLTPQSEQDDLMLNDRDYARQKDVSQKNPDKWVEDVPDRSEDTPLLEIDLSLNGSSNCSYDKKCNALKSHCRGMSQYGAYGMAKSTNPATKKPYTYEEILKFYYGDIAFTKIDTNSSIQVKIDKGDDDCSSGQTISLNFEQYLTALGEMPDSWGKNGMEALKAQAVAARTYAYIRTKGLTKSICNTSNCQVFRCSNIGAKPNLSQAVQATAGIIIVDATTQKLFPTEYARSFCGSSNQITCNNHTIPSVDANKNNEYEKLGHPKTQYCKS